MSTTATYTTWSTRREERAAGVEGIWHFGVFFINFFYCESDVQLVCRCAIAGWSPALDSTVRPSVLCAIPTGPFKQSASKQQGRAHVKKVSHVIPA